MQHWYVISDDARPASYESGMQRLLRIHNQIAVFVLTAATVLALATMDHAAVAERYGPFVGRVYGGTIALVSVELLLWHFLYKHGGIEARWAAGLMGAWFAILIFVQLARASIDVPVNPWDMALCLYMLGAHVTYAFFGSRARD